MYKFIYVVIFNFFYLSYKNVVQEPWPPVAVEEEKPENPWPGVGIFVLNLESLGSKLSERV